MLVDKDYSLMWALTFTIFARFAKFRVESVSWKQRTEQDIVAIMDVLEFPPNESRSKFVNFESLYGIWFLGFSDVNALITIPRVVKDLLMFPASLSLSPEAAVIFCLSDPAKSTKWSLGVLRVFFPSIELLRERAMVKMEWDLED